MNTLKGFSFNRETGTFTKRFVVECEYFPEEDLYAATVVNDKKDEAIKMFSSEESKLLIPILEG